VQNVEVGGKLVDEAGKTMDEIVAAVKRVEAIVSEISAASQEQKSGIEAVNVTIARMEEVTQQNAHLVQQAAAAASHMKDQAVKLEKAVEIFKVGHVDTGVTSKRSMLTIKVLR
jgi:methyl-accepting chemotaxis protein